MIKKEIAEIFDRFKGGVMTRIIDSTELMLDLHRAYLDARKNKRGKEYQLEFEYKLEDNLVELRDELMSGNYRPRSSTCFIIHEPKMREVFAASFRDRVVHHLFYNYVHVLFEREFIYDSYSCIKGRGTHFGVERLQHHIRSVSAGYSRPCYVLKIDIKGYFMAIDRSRLLEICLRTMARMRDKPSDEEGLTWGEKIDYPFVDYLLESIVTNDPTKGCVMLGDPSDWEKLPPEKSLFHAAPGCGLPIGNLSSQLFSNIYMNEFDQFAKRELGCKHYGRYVDDAFVVSCDREWLKSLVPRIETFLKEHLGLSLNHNKLRICDASRGVEFLGAYILPFRTYVSSSSLRRIKSHLLAWQPATSSRLFSLPPQYSSGSSRLSSPLPSAAPSLLSSPRPRHFASSSGLFSLLPQSPTSPSLLSTPRPRLSAKSARLLQSRVNSWLGVLSHYDSHCLRRVLFGYIADLPGSFSRDWLRFKLDGFVLRPGDTFLRKERERRMQGNALTERELRSIHISLNPFRKDRREIAEDGKCLVE